ncbi:MAG: TetR family transcriptional regulator, partial [Micromonosporaceae bacterium]|nr:TetR family transcriptional regulator [Micromonosporaceae bacterium]
YRRWSSRMELVMAAVYHAIPDPASPPDMGNLRGDLLALLRLNAELMAGPAGEAMRGLLSEALSEAGGFSGLRRLSRGAGRTAMLEITRRAVERGEIDADAVTARRLEVGQAMVRQHFLFQGTPIPDEVLVEIVDEVVVPLFTGAQSGRP